MNLTIFDLDHTLLEGDCDQLWGDFLSQQGLVNKEEYQNQKNQFYQDYLSGQLDMQQFLSFCANTLSQFTSTELAYLGKEFAQTWLKPRLRPHALSCIEQHLTQGDDLLVITATNFFLASQALSLLPIEHLIASDLEMNNGRYTGKPVGIPPYREGKWLRLTQWLNERGQSQVNLTFYSDSHNDLALLNRVNHPVAVSPDDILLQHAQRNLWPIEHWSTVI